MKLLVVYKYKKEAKPNPKKKNEYNFNSYLINNFNMISWITVGYVS